jgi:hypothetical protein
VTGARLRPRPALCALWVGNGTFTVVWGLWLLAPWWTVLTRADIYQAMEDFMPEWGWGVNAVLAGTAQVYGVLERSRRGLVWGTVAGVYHWGVISLLYLISDWANTGWLVSAWLALSVLLLWWAWERLEREEAS